MDNTTIELTPADALLFIAFQKRHAFMQLLESVGAFDMKNGTLTIHYDKLGAITSVDTHLFHRL